MKRIFRQTKQKKSIRKFDFLLMKILQAAQTQLMQFAF